MLLVEAFFNQKKALYVTRWCRLDEAGAGQLCEAIERLERASFALSQVANQIRQRERLRLVRRVA